MIYEAINCIQRKLNPVVGTVAANIAEIIAADASLPNGMDARMVMTLVNVEENRISRDPRNYQRAGAGILLKNPAVHLHLTLLFTAIRSETGYDNALRNLQSLIGFFQAQPVFDRSNTPDLDPRIEKLILEMVSLNMEQLNHLWSIMGGRYQPSVVYRMRMVTIDSVSQQEGDLIKEIEANYQLKRD